MAPRTAAELSEGRECGPGPPGLQAACLSPPGHVASWLCPPQAGVLVIVPAVSSLGFKTPPTPSQKNGAGAQWAGRSPSMHLALCSVLSIR